jgi:hypothetical protein
MTHERRGEKIGWIGGWLGGFIWLLILSLVWFFQSRTGWGLIGLGLCATGVICILVCAPWRRPKTLYWKLMTPIYVVLFGSVGLAVTVTGARTLGLTWWSLLWLCPLLIPLATIGRRCWDESSRS